MAAHLHPRGYHGENESAEAPCPDTKNMFNIWKKMHWSKLAIS